MPERGLRLITNVVSETQELLDGLRRGDPLVLDQLYRKYRQPVMAAVRRRAGTLASAADVQDLVHEVFIKAFSFSGRRNYDRVRGYWPYLRGITHNTVIDWHRRRRCEPVLPGPDFAGADNALLDHWLTPPAPAPAPAPANEAMDDGTRTLLRDHLASLAPTLQQLHELRYHLDLSQAEVATRLGLSRQQVRTLEAKLRGSVRRALRRADGVRTLRRHQRDDLAAL